MRGRLKKLHPFTTPVAQRLALLFGIVYFAQGMWYLPNQTITSPSRMRDCRRARSPPSSPSHRAVADQARLRPPLGLRAVFGFHRKSYLMLTSATAAAAGLLLGVTGEHSYLRMATFFTCMALGLAFTDVLVDALMVENGKPLGLTGAFQSVQWGAITVASILVGESAAISPSIAGCTPPSSSPPAFPSCRSSWPPSSCARRPPGKSGRSSGSPGGPSARRWPSARSGWWRLHLLLDVQPILRPRLLYYQTDVLHFSQQFIGHLGALGAVAGVVGALIYAPLSRLLPSSV